jgi:hypothetical protein
VRLEGRNAKTDLAVEQLVDFVGEKVAGHQCLEERSERRKETYLCGSTMSLEGKFQA